MADVVCGNGAAARDIGGELSGGNSASTRPEARGRAPPQPYSCGRGEQSRRGCLDFCVSEPYFKPGGRYGDQERDYRRVVEG